MGCCQSENAFPESDRRRTRIAELTSDERAAFVRRRSLIRNMVSPMSDGVQDFEFSEQGDDMPGLGLKIITEDEIWNQVDVIW